MVGVEVADDDRLDVGRIDQPGQPRERALAEVEHAGSRLAWRSRYEAPVAPGRSVYAGPAPMTSSRIGLRVSPAGALSAGPDLRRCRIVALRRPWIGVGGDVPTFAGLPGLPGSRVPLSTRRPGP